jgi:hypothetical protein
VFLPSYWKYEPRDYSEGFDVTLATAALAGFVLGVSGIARGAAAWVRTSSRAQAWRQRARPLKVAGTSMRAFEIDGDAPIVALVGILRPRLFITHRVVAALTDEELAASVAHELGHRRAFDNLKRLAMRTAPDFLATTSVASLLERRWASASEHVADRSACEMVSLADRGRARCALASAIVKVARMMPPMTPAATRSAPPWPPPPWHSASRRCSGSCTSRPRSSSTPCRKSVHRLPAPLKRCPTTPLWASRPTEDVGRAPL